MNQSEFLQANEEDQKYVRGMYEHWRASDAGPEPNGLIRVLEGFFKQTVPAERSAADFVTEVFVLLESAFVAGVCYGIESTKEEKTNGQNN